MTLNEKNIYIQKHASIIRSIDFFSFIPIWVWWMNNDGLDFLTEVSETLAKASMQSNGPYNEIIVKWDMKTTELSDHHFSWKKADKNGSF